jgi:gliding motility-associated-like protein
VSQTVIIEPGELIFDFQQILPARFTSCDGIISASIPNAAGTVSYTWTVSGNGGAGTGPKVENLCAGRVVTFLATDANGCTATARDTLPYPLDGCLEMSPVITPGSDGKNDVFLITCVEATLDNKVEIFNRWGQLVFETTNYNNFSNSWQGLTARGESLPEGVYFVVVTYKNELGETFVRKTYVNIVRP